MYMAMIAFYDYVFINMHACLMIHIIYIYIYEANTNSKPNYKS